MNSVLIIDDETEICLLLSTLFKKNGFETCTAFSLEEGKKKISEFNPKVVILDINLPDGEGFELIPQIKLETNASVIMITARDGKREEDLSKSLGATAFLRKPFSGKKILKTVEKITQTSK